MNLAESHTDYDCMTGKQLWAMGDIGSCELIDGKIIKMSPTGGEHGWLETKLIGRLFNFVSEEAKGWILGGEVGIYTQRNPDRVRGADIVFISKERSPQRPQKGFLSVSPELVIEIISPSDRWNDVQQKIEEYLNSGVDHVWVVNPENRSVLVYHSLTEIQRFVDGDAVVGDGVLHRFKLSVTDLFDE